VLVLGQHASGASHMLFEGNNAAVLCPTRRCFFFFCLLICKSLVLAAGETRLAAVFAATGSSAQTALAMRLPGAAADVLSQLCRLNRENSHLK
jgi:hypothetical protein